jgi:hypothetical protein
MAIDIRNYRCVMANVEEFCGNTGYPESRILVNPSVLVPNIIQKIGIDTDNLSQSEIDETWENLELHLKGKGWIPA